MNEIEIPRKLKPIVKAFFGESDQAAKALIQQAAKAIYGSKDERDDFDLYTKDHHVTTEELENICTFMQGIRPTDMLEAIIAAQITIAHMLAIRKLSKVSNEDCRIGMNMLRFSNEAINLLQKKRAGRKQEIVVNYNYGQVHEVKQEVTPNQLEVYADQRS